VQVGTFSHRELADRLARQVRTKGFVVQVAGPDGRGLYRVRTPPLAERAEAQALRQKMQARGLKPIVNSTP
jgi:cell division protein FtsN